DVPPGRRQRSPPSRRRRARPLHRPSADRDPRRYDHGREPARPRVVLHLAISDRRPRRAPPPDRPFRLTSPSGDTGTAPRAAIVNYATGPRLGCCKPDEVGRADWVELRSNEARSARTTDRGRDAGAGRAARGAEPRPP